jgi:hypothetical protein
VSRGPFAASPGGPLWRPPGGPAAACGGVPGWPAAASAGGLRRRPRVACGGVRGWPAAASAAEAPDCLVAPCGAHSRYR